MFFMYFRGLCTDSIRKSPTHNSTRPSQGLPVKPQWTSCARFGHSFPGVSGHFALGLSSRTDRNLAVWLTCGRKALYTHKAFSMERPQYRKPLARKAVGKESPQYGKPSTRTALSTVSPQYGKPSIRKAFSPEGPQYGKPSVRKAGKP